MTYILLSSVWLDVWSDISRSIITPQLISQVNASAGNSCTKSYLRGLPGSQITSSGNFLYKNYLRHLPEKWVTVWWYMNVSMFCIHTYDCLVWPTCIWLSHRYDDRSYGYVPGIMYVLYAYVYMTRNHMFIPGSCVHTNMCQKYTYDLLVYDHISVFAYEYEYAT